MHLLAFERRCLLRDGEGSARDWEEGKKEIERERDGWLRAPIRSFDEIL